MCDEAGVLSRLHCRKFRISHLAFLHLPQFIIKLLICCLISQMIKQPYSLLVAALSLKLPFIDVFTDYHTKTYVRKCLVSFSLFNFFFICIYIIIVIYIAAIFFSRIRQTLDNRDYHLGFP